MNPARIRHLIKMIEVDEVSSDNLHKIYIDFHDAGGPRWYLMFLVQMRCFGVARSVMSDHTGGAEIPGALRSYLISIIPPEIIARCTAAALGIPFPADYGTRRPSHEPVPPRSRGRQNTLPMR